MRVLFPLAAAVAALFMAVPAYAAPKVAVVDMELIISKYKSSQEAGRARTKAEQEADKDYERDKKRLEELKKDLAKLDENDPGRPLMEKRYLTQVNMMKFNHEWALRQAEKRYVQAIARLYRAIQGEVGRYARENGIELVLLREGPDEPLEAPTLQDFVLKTKLRRVIFAAPEADITDAIVARIPEKERVK